MSTERTEQAMSAVPGQTTSTAPQPGGRRARRHMAACCDLPRELCEQYLSGLLRGARSDRLAMRRVGRQNCAIFQCIEERGLVSCLQCVEGPAGCVFHEQLDRICPAGAPPVLRQAWRLRAPPAEAAGGKPGDGRPKTTIPERSIARLRWYLAALEQFRRAGIGVVSSADIASKVGVSSSLVRRDLCYFGQFGTPSLGYHVDELSERVLSLFRADDGRRVAWVGAERLMGDPTALSEFAAQDWQIIAVFDPDPDRVGTQIGNLQVMHISSLGQVARNLRVNTAALAVDESIAQEVAEQLMAVGVDAILNLTPVPLALPARVAVQQADLATQLMLLSYYARLARAREEK